MISFLRDLRQWRNVDADVIQMLVLTARFTDDGHEGVRKDGHDIAIDVLELRLLGAFVVTAIYLAMRRNKKIASIALNRFHKHTAEAILNINLSLLQERHSADAALAGRIIPGATLLPYCKVKREGRRNDAYESRSMESCGSIPALCE